MDALDALIGIAHLKLRLETLQRHPELLDTHMATTTPVLPAPMEFAGLKSRLQRARGLEARAGVVGPRVDAALDVIEQGVGVLETHAPELEKYGADLMSTITGMLAPSNGDPNPGPLPGAAPTLPTAAVPATPTAGTPGVAVATSPTLGPNGGPRIHN